MWLRHSQTVSDAWNEVLEMDLRKTSRDQNNFNEVRPLSRPSDLLEYSFSDAPQVLGSAELRLHNDGGDPGRKPLKFDFIARNGLRVHVLDANIFRSHHFEIDRPYAARNQSVVCRRSLFFFSLEN